MGFSPGRRLSYLESAPMNQKTCHLLWLGLLGMMAGGCGSPSASSSLPARAVTFVKLKTSNPGEMSRLTGTAESWKREELAFEVPGRVIDMVEPGKTIKGETFDEDGNLLDEGDILAEIDDERYQLALKQAQAAAEAARTELEQVIPEQLNEALAALELQDKQVERYTQLVAENAASKQDLDRFIAGQKTAKANVAKIEALRATKGSELNTLLAQIEQAERNIRDCKLISPFTGQIARVHIIPGGYAYRGIPVLTVQMMDPMKVDIAVSPKTDDRINQNDLLSVYTPSGERLDGLVYLKDTFADPSTRTFLVTLLVRNFRTEVGVPEELRGKGVPRCRHLWKLERADASGEGNFYTEVNAIHQDSKGYYVWKAANLTVQQLSTDFSPVVTVSKVYVEPGEDRIPVLRVFTLRELANARDLDPATDVIVGGIYGDDDSGEDTAEKLKEGGQVILVRDRWSLRPGDVVQVAIRGQAVTPGFYVPEHAIQYDGSRHFVVVAEKTEEGYRAAHVPVTVGETAGDLQRIEAADEQQLAEATRVIVEGAHYLRPGDPIRPVQEVDPRP